jgi:hypothetical protein
MDCLKKFTEFKRQLNALGNIISEEHLIRFDYKVIASGLLVAIVFFLLVVFKIHGSSIAIWNQIIPDGKDKRLGLIAGTPKQIRSDEWRIATPFQLSQAARGFPVENAGLGAGKTPLILGGMTPVPVYHYTMFFMPQLWGFFLLDVERAFAFYWNWKVFGLFFSFFLLLLLCTRNNFGLALAGAGWMYLSGYMQWYFSTSDIDLVIAFCMLCITGVYLFLSKKKILILLSAFGLVIFALNFALLLYLPDQITLGYLCLFFSGGYLFQYFRKDVFLPQKTFRLIAGMVVLVVTFITLYSLYVEAKETITTMAHTAYPGQRRINGGGMNLAYYFSGFYNTFYTQSEFPKILGRWNVCGASSFIFLFPIAWIVFMKNGLFTRKGKILLYLQSHSVEICLSLYILLITIWMFWGFPPIIAKFTLFDRIIPTRMNVALGVANIILVMMCLTHPNPSQTFTFPRDGAWLALLLIVYLAFGLYLKQTDVFFTVWRILIVSLAFTVISYALLKRHKIVFSLGLLTMLSPNFFVNPVAIGLSPIFDHELARVAGQIARNDPHAKWIVFGNPSMVNYFKAFGINMFNGVKFMPDLQSMRVLDPALQFKNIYNRYANIHVLPVSPGKVRFKLVRTDLYSISIHPCSQQLQQLGIKYVVFADFIPTREQAACLFPIAAMGNIRIFEQRTLSSRNNEDPHTLFTKMSGFPDISALTPLSSSTSYSIDAINGLLIHGRPQPIIFNDVENVDVSGWAIDNQAKDVAGGVYLEIDGLIAPTVYGVSRLDVARFFKNPGYENSGFKGTIPVERIGKGRHILAIKILTKDKKAYYSPDTKVVFEIK